MATILIIDDEEPIRVLLHTALEAAGYEVTEAVNGREGLCLYRHQPADLVITDIRMPELNGLDMLLEQCENECLAVSLFDQHMRAGDLEGEVTLLYAGPPNKSSTQRICAVRLLGNTSTNEIPDVQSRW